MTIQKYSYSGKITFFENIFSKWNVYSGTAEVCLPQPIESVPLNDIGLTNMAMQLSESSLAKKWENEEDDYWASYPSVK